MSTYWGYACESHDPPLVSEHWVNHGEDVLTETFRAVRAGRWPTVPPLDEPAPVLFHGDECGSAAPIHWLNEHPRCAVVLHNEYGDRRILGETISGGIIRTLDAGPTGGNSR